jgi:hypothetical protein
MIQPDPGWIPDDLAASLKRLPRPSPRNTTWWKRQAPELRRACQHLFDDDEFCRILDVTVAFLNTAFRLQAESELRAQALMAVGDPTAAEIVREGKLKPEAVAEALRSSFYPALADAASRASPPLAFVLGDRRLVAWLAGLVVAVAAVTLVRSLAEAYGVDIAQDFEGQDRVADALAQAFEHALARTPDDLLHLPDDNPLTALTADGAVVAGVDDAKPKHLLDLAAYVRSLRSEGKSGRAKRTPKVKGSGHPPISREKALDALEMPWTAWAPKHAPDLDLTDDKQREAARQRHFNARLRGRRLTNS